MVNPGLPRGTQVKVISTGEVGPISEELPARRSYMVTVRFAQKDRDVEYTYAELALAENVNDNAATGNNLFSASSVNPDEYLAALAKQEKARQEATSTSQVRQIRRSGQTFTGGFDSGKGNHDCVLAAMGTVFNVNPVVIASTYQEKTGITMTATDGAIQGIAKVLGMQPGSRQALKSALKQGKRAFVRTQALFGTNLHAYCAFGITQDDYVVAWDPDYEHRDCKEIPLELIDEQMIFISK